MLIENTSDAVITDVNVGTSENLEVITIDTLQPKESTEQFLSMKTNRIDGSYTISFVKDGIPLARKNVGYYTNGIPLDERLHLTIDNDTLLIDFPEAAY